MAIQTPFHIQRLLLSNKDHLVDATVATDAPDPASDVSTVVEVRVVSDLVNAHPRHRFAGGPTVANWLQ